MISTRKLYIALAVALLVAVIGFTVFKPEPARVTIVHPHELQPEPACVPEGAYVLSRAQQIVNEVVQPTCTVR